jgi:uncharacterized membrane protein
LVILVVFLIAYYFLFIKEKPVIIEEEKIIKPQKKNADYENLIDDIEQNISKYDKDMFYKKVDKILRLYLEEK